MNDYHDATKWACDQFEDLILDGKLDFPEYTFANAVAAWSMDIKMNVKKNDQPYYNVSNESAALLLEFSSSHYQFFDLCIEICRLNILSDAGLPDPLKMFATDVLAGKKKRPTPSHRERNSDWLEHSFIWTATQEIATLFNLTITRNDESIPQSACDAIAEALTVCGKATTFTEIKRLMVHKDYEQTRSEIRAVGRMWNRRETTKYPVNVLHP